MRRAPRLSGAEVIGRRQLVPRVLNPGMTHEAADGFQPGIALRDRRPRPGFGRSRPASDAIRRSAACDPCPGVASASTGPLAPYLEYSPEELVSTDIVRSPASCTFDSKLTMASGRLAKVFGWYDNEWGYSCRLVDLVPKLL